MSSQRPIEVLLAVFDKAASAMLCEYLRSRGAVCNGVESVEKLQSELAVKAPDVTVVELGKDAVPLDQVRRLAPETTVVALAAPDPQLFFAAAKAGVETVLALPLDPQDYVAKLEDVTDGFRRTAVGRETLDVTRVPSLFATSAEMAEVRSLIEKVAPTSATVLIRGESGVGKELAARLVHALSLRVHKPFVKVNCAAIPNDLLESELFGYEAGAFTGAVKSKPGKFELANGGTIFLDEIGEMQPLLQAKLLHVLQDGEYSRLGAKKDVAVDVRVICATNKPLDALVMQGQFREDLFYRINVVTVMLPPLRSRRREIPGLIDHFVRRFAATYGRPMVAMDQASIDWLTSYQWPGNIRELENLCKRYVIVGGLNLILAELEEKRSSIAAEIGSPTNSAQEEADGLSLLEIGRRAAWSAERTAIRAMLQETRWNRREAARRLQVSYKALLNKIQQMESEAQEQGMALQ